MGKAFDIGLERLIGPSVSGGVPQENGGGEAVNDDPGPFLRQGKPFTAQGRTDRLPSRLGAGRKRSLQRQRKRADVLPGDIWMPDERARLGEGGRGVAGAGV